jgi:hypothetical protein
VGLACNQSEPADATELKHYWSDAQAKGIYDPYMYANAWIDY